MRAALIAALLAAPAAAQEGDAVSRLAAAYAGLTTCTMPAMDDRHETHAVSVDVPWSDEPMAVTVGLFVCAVGAYNVTQVVLIDDGWEAAPAPLPQLAVTGAYADEAQEELRDLIVLGLGASLYATNASFDPATGRLTSNALYRGLGDASGFSAWRLDGLRFVLERQEEDLSWDGAENPWVVVDGGAPVTPRPVE